MRSRRRNTLAHIAADQTDDLLVLTAYASHVDVVDVADGDFGRVAGAGRSRRLVALVDHDWQSDVPDSEVLEGDVPDVAVSSASSGRSAGAATKGLDAGAILSVDHRHILDKDVGDDVLNAGVLAQRAYGDAVRALTVEILDKCVGGVGFEADAIISVDDVAVRDADDVASVDVPSIGVLCLLAACLN